MFVECACQKWNQNSSYSCSTRCNRSPPRFRASGCDTPISQSHSYSCLIPFFYASRGFCPNGGKQRCGCSQMRHNLVRAVRLNAFETTAVEERAGFVLLKARATGMAVEIGWQRKLMTGAPGEKKLTTLLAVNEDLGVPTHSEQSEKFLDLGTVTRPPSSIYARVNCFVIRDWCTRVQGHPRNLFRRPSNFGLSSQKHHTWPYHASVLWYTEANFSFQMQQRNFPRPYLRNDTMDFLF